MTTITLADRVWETSTTTGTGTLTLAGAKAGYQSFAAVGDGKVTVFCITDGVNWEVTQGTYTASGTTLTRLATPISSSNGGAAVSFGAGSKDVFVCLPASRAAVADQSGATALANLWLAPSGIIAFDAGGSTYLNMNTSPNVLNLSNASFSAPVIGFNGPGGGGGNTGSSITIDFTGYQYYEYVINANCTFTFTAPARAGVYHLQLTQDGTGSRVGTFPTLKWDASYAAGDKLLSTAAGARDLMVLRWNGTDYIADLKKGIA